MGRFHSLLSRTLKNIYPKNWSNNLRFCFLLSLFAKTIQTERDYFRIWKKKFVYSSGIFLAMREVTTIRPLSRYDDNQILLRTIQAIEKCGCFVLKHINIPVPDWPSGMTVVDP